MSKGKSIILRKWVFHCDLISTLYLVATHLVAFAKESLYLSRHFEIAISFLSLKVIREFVPQNARELLSSLHGDR